MNIEKKKDYALVVEILLESVLHGHRLSSENFVFQKAQELKKELLR